LNNVTPYEILIAEKVEQLPIPDMSDLIWANIEAELDSDLPNDSDGGANNKPGPRTGLPGTGKGFIVLAIVAAVVTSVFLLRGRKNKDVPTTVPPSSQPSLPAASPANESTRRRTEATIPLPVDAQTDAPVTLDNPTAPGIDGIAPPIDTNVAVILPPPLPDSVQKKGITVAPPDTLSKKKPRGVTGISNDDYRISGRDSSEKKKN
jgi:hypothetical protein